PLGAVEEHGPHLPLLVDWLGAEELARRIAPHLERAGLTPVLAPSLPYGVSTLAAEWPGTVSLSRALVTRLIVEVIRALARHGFRSFVLVNYQADPDHLAAMDAAKRALAWVDFRGRLRKGARRFREIDARTLGYFGWPAAARAETALKVMRLRGKLIAAEVIRALGPLPRTWRPRGWGG